MSRAPACHYTPTLFCKNMQQLLLLQHTFGVAIRTVSRCCADPRFLGRRKMAELQVQNQASCRLVMYEFMEPKKHRLFRLCGLHHSR